MKIYNVMKVPQGLGYDDVDYDAIYQSGYTAGYQSGYDAYECFYVYPTEIEDNEGTGGTYIINVVALGPWTTSWDGMMPGSNWCTFSPSSGEGSGQITLTLQPFENPEGSYEHPRVGDLTITNSKGQSAVVQASQRPQEIPTQLTFGIYDYCSRDYTDDAYIYLGQSGVPTQTIVRPLGREVNLVYASSDPSLVTIDSAGTVDCVSPRPWEEVTLTVTDSISSASSSIRLFIDSNESDWHAQENDCPCTDFRYLNDCGCIPASGGTYHQSVALNYPCWWQIEGIRLKEKPDWIDVSPTYISAGPMGLSETLTYVVDACTEAAQTPGEYRTGTILFENVGGVVSSTFGHDISQNKPEAPVATALTWQTETECGDILYNFFSIENGQTIHTDVVPSPSGVSTNLVFTSTNSAITIDSNGNITRSGGTNFDEIEVSVMDTISNITLSGSVFCEAIPYIFTLHPNDCPCCGVDYHNDCSCVPASGGTYHNMVNFSAPWNYNLTSVQLSSKPSWVTVNPSAWTICEQGAGNLTFTVEPCNEYASGTDTYRDGWVEFIGNDVSGLTGGFYIKQNKLEPPTVEKYVADLVDEGYANFIQSGGTYKGGNYVEILSSCPYDMSQIVDLEDVALNQKQLSGIQNTIVWNQIRPSGWTVEDIAAIYNGQSLNYTPRGGQFWAITSAVSSFTITYTGDTYVTSDYPWGSYSSEGVFAPRWNQNREGEYAANGWLSTPETVTVNFASTFSSVSQVMFTQMKDTRTLTINQLAGTFACHDVTGMFEGNNSLETLNINGAFNFSTWRTQHNVFDNCTELTGIPYSTAWTREHANNEIYPHNDGVRGSANCYHMFRGCTSLTYLGPVFNMGAISLSGCTYDGRSQAALSDTLFNCPALEDVRIKNLNNNDWNFTDTSTYTQIPNMNVASIEYLLNNVEDVTAAPHTVTLSTLHQGEISQSAIDNATSKGWTIAYA